MLQQIALVTTYIESYRTEQARRSVIAIRFGPPLLPCCTLSLPLLVTLSPGRCFAARYSHYVGGRRRRSSADIGRRIAGALQLCFARHVASHNVCVVLSPGRAPGA